MPSGQKNTKTKAFRIFIAALETLTHFKFLELIILLFLPINFNQWI